MEKYTHYGAEVTYQACVDRDFKDFLTKEGIAYTELPILEEDVITYVIDGSKKYAIITYPTAIEAGVENIYITTVIPDDLSWTRLIYDVNAQRRGEPPMNMPSKPRVYFDAAYDFLLKRRIPIDYNIELLTIDPPKFEKKDLDTVLAAYGTSIDELLAMPHDDTPELDEYAENE